MDVRTFTGGGFGENAYLAICGESGACVAIDPGGGAGALVEAVRDDALDLQAILLTHAHLDHIEGVSTVRALDAELPIWLHPADFGLYEGVQRQAALFGLRAEPQPAPTHRIVPGDPHTFGHCVLDVRFAPGHAPGHVIFVAADAGLAFVGDVVFQGSIGRTDLPGGDFETLMTSIAEQVLTLPDTMRLFTGHGPATTVGAERRYNPFLAQFIGERT